MVSLDLGNGDGPGRVEMLGFAASHELREGGKESMPTRMSGSYAGHLEVDVVHGPSGMPLRVAAPTDTGGDASSFSPTDLLAAGLGSSSLILMAVAADREAIAFRHARFEIEKTLGGPPRRIVQLVLRIHLSAKLTARQRSILEQVARSCPVALSLQPEVETIFSFVYEDVEG